MAGEKGSDTLGREVEALEARVHRGVFEVGGQQRTEDIMVAIRSGELGLGNAIRRGHHDAVGQYLAATMSPESAANTYRDLVSGVAGWY